MNERIKKLLTQAGVNDNWNEADWYSLSPAMVEMFAELIVTECANELIRWKDEPFPYDPEFGARLIKDHFGIEK